MCGIAGVLGPVDEFAETSTVRMNNAMLHRGPDQGGCGKVLAPNGVVLGHRRLSILDLSEAGRQPMLDQATGVAIAFNGECYNFRELRAELEATGRSFVSTSDTEVVLAAYIWWGEAAIERLRGMFAFAIWDPREDACCWPVTVLVLSRCITRSRTVACYSHRSYVRCWQAKLCSASSIRVSLATYLWHGFVPGPRTLLQGVQLLPAGHLLSLAR